MPRLLNTVLIDSISAPDEIIAFFLPPPGKAMEIKVLSVPR